MTASEASSAADSAKFRNDIVALIPQLRAFARGLCAGRPIAEDLAQDTLVKAWRSQASFAAGTNLKAWLFTILRNEYYSSARRGWRQTHLTDEKAAAIAAPPNEQEWKIQLCDLTRALEALPDGQREALILVGAGGFTYLEAAEICGTAVGTMKSRMARGRQMMIQLLDGDEPLPERGLTRPTDASNEILAQLSAITKTAPARLAVLA